MRYILINWKSSDEFHLRHLQIHLCNICVFVCCIMNFFHSPHIKRSICIWIFCRFRLSVRVILWSQVFLFLSTKAEWKWPAAKRLWSHTHTHILSCFFFPLFPALLNMWFISAASSCKSGFTEKHWMKKAIFQQPIYFWVAEMRWFGKSHLYPLVNGSLVCQLISFTTTAAGCSAFWSRDVKMYPAAGWF